MGRAQPIRLLVGAILFTGFLPCCGGSALSQPNPDLDSDDVVFHEESAFQHVYVVEEGNSRCLRFDSPEGDNQSQVLLDNPRAMPMECIRLATVSLAHIQAPRKVLMIGLGGGNFSNLIWRSFPGVEIDAVEIDPVVAKVAREYFGVPDEPGYRVHVGDGGEFVKRNEGPFDLIFLDAYDGTDIPQHLAGREFFSLVKTRLEDGGIAVLNMAVPDEKEHALMEEFEAVFPDPACYRAIQDDNLIVISGGGDALAPETTADRAAKLQGEVELPFRLELELAKRVDCSRIGPGH